MAGSPAAGENQTYRFPAFFDRLHEEGALDVRDAVDSETEVDGVLYHHRGLQVPGRTARFVDDPDWDDGTGVFGLELDPVGPRTARATFDADRDWDVYLVLFEGGAVVAWMTDAEFETDEADAFPSKEAAVNAGQFSFGAVFQFGPDWVEREEWARESTAPATLQLGDGRLLAPSTTTEYRGSEEAIPPELRPGDDRSAPEHLGLRYVRVTYDGDRNETAGAAGQDHPEGAADPFTRDDWEVTDPSSTGEDRDDEAEWL